MGKIIGIDLGSCNSCVSVMEGGAPTVIVNEEGGRTTPSVISFKDGDRKVGNAAKRQAVVNPKNTVILVKRFMGGTYDEVKESISHVQYEVKNVNGYPRIVIDGREYSPEELSATILSKMKSIAENYLGETVKDAVITVPAYFSSAAKEATKRAGEIAGLNVVRLVAEPTAAILDSNIDKVKGGKYLVVDYGGATLDFSVADIADNVVEILSSNGDVYCGGSDIDKLVAKYLVDTFKADNGVDLSGDMMAMSRIYEAAEKAKCELSQLSVTEINLPYITAINGTPAHLNISLTRAKFDEIIDGEISKVIKCGKEALVKAGVTADELNGVLLVGGSCRIIKVQDELIKAFGDKLIKSNSLDESVSRGATAEAAVLSGERNDILLLDVLSIRVGLETQGGIMTPIIESNTTIPTTKTQTFSTAVDNQPAVTIQVLQGERPMAKDNKLIGTFNLEGIMPAPRGVPQIEVTFDIDANGILSVKAVDKATGKEQKIRIEGASSLSDDEIKRMKAEAEANAEADKKERARMDKINAADSLAFQTEKQLKELGDKVPADKKAIIEEAITNVKKAVEDKDADACEKYSKQITDTFHEVASQLYGAAAGATGQGNPMDMFNQMFGGAGGNAQTQQPNTDTAADFEEVK